MPNNKVKAKKKKYFLFIGGIVVILVLRAAFCGKKDSTIIVQTEKATKRTITQVVTATGKIRPVNQVVITPEVTGEIVELPVIEGQSVKKDQLLIKIKPDMYIAQKERAKANLDSARANLAMKKVELDYAKAEYERASKLFKAGVANPQQVDKAQSELSVASAQYDSLRASVSQAEASLKESDESLKKTTIFSPMAGTVIQLNVKLGERVLGSGFSQGTDIMTVADLSRMEATVEVDENDVVLVSENDLAKIEVDAFKNKQFTGRVSQIGNSARSTGIGTQEINVNFEVRIALDKGGEEVMPGMSCNADIETETRENVLSVPIISITARSPEKEKKPGNSDDSSDEEDEVLIEQKKKSRTRPQEIVFVVNGDKVGSKPVKTGISDDSYIEIREGLSGGEEVVSGPYKAISKELDKDSKVRVDNEKKSGKEDKK